MTGATQNGKGDGEGLRLVCLACKRATVRPGGRCRVVTCSRCGGPLVLAQQQPLPRRHNEHNGKRRRTGMMGTEHNGKGEGT